MKKLFDVEITRYYSKSIVIVVEAESEQDARDEIERNQSINNEIDNRLSETTLAWDDDSIEIYEVEQEAV